MDTNVAAICMIRVVGSSILGFATLMAYGRTSASAEAHRVIALALMVQDLVGALAFLEIQLRGIVNALSWLNSILYALLALGYAWFRFVHPQDSWVYSRSNEGCHSTNAGKPPITRPESESQP